MQRQQLSVGSASGLVSQSREILNVLGNASTRWGRSMRYSAHLITSHPAEVIWRRYLSEQRHNASPSQQALWTTFTIRDAILVFTVCEKYCETWKPFSIERRCWWLPRATNPAKRNWQDLIFLEKCPRRGKPVECLKLFRGFANVEATTQILSFDLCRGPKSNDMKRRCGKVKSKLKGNFL